MYKKLILIIILLLLLCISKKNKYTFDKINPHNIIIFVAEKPNYIKIVNDNLSYNINYIEEIYKEHKITLNSDLLSNFYKGQYLVCIGFDNYSKIINLEIKNYNNQFSIITKNDLFKIQLDTYIVLFTKENCYSCEKIRPNAIIYNDYSTSINFMKKINLYVLKYENPINSSLFGSNINIDGVNNVDDLVISSFPTLIIIKNNQVIEYYLGAKDVGEYFDNLIDEKKV